MNTITFKLKFDIQSDWHIGSGEEGGAKADALVLKDEQGLPYLPGRAVKGLLREAFQKAEDNQWFTQSCTVATLFGCEGTGIATQGIITVSNAVMQPSERRFFLENSKAKQHLYRVLYSTAIEHDSGVAKETSLRSMEVNVPMQLNAEIDLYSDDETWVDKITRVVPLITHVGAKRHRGLGQVMVSVEDNKEAYL
ncbi:RAMP superfamily CRISPR-associated protein [Vibrio sp. 10N.222.51.C8]|uniref:RAMP superfamily CRISPR-associated protein n=2 Tax=Vibrio TaxID=662 RepID=UPI000C863ADA|nr:MULTISPECIES: RAMP superfamily CRISPR-associated protein [unclassified Vibrio]PMO01651.1 hypothetical protein BCT20_11400 [Vibrio sp. 10N.222.55.C12]PMO02826.1 hypothetical protein BCT21_07280 [Vibrio sp. 10N.222.55.F9]PMO13586.1 hypothetical protein BCT17_14360 [Vibrio sp. 10N.222.54.F10]PMO14647.1 hypothetical protein BCT16_18860 [Vibrio sp. 10N.222.54.B6]TKF38527.1 hypothetical protein FCV49_21710 [Vibrio sp. F13]